MKSYSLKKAFVAKQELNTRATCWAKRILPCWGDTRGTVGAFAVLSSDGSPGGAPTQLNPQRGRYVHSPGPGCFDWKSWPSKQILTVLTYFLSFVFFQITEIKKLMETSISMKRTNHRVSMVRYFFILLASFLILLENFNSDQVLSELWKCPKRKEQLLWWKSSQKRTNFFEILFFFLSFLSRMTLHFSLNHFCGEPPEQESAKRQNI